MSKCSIQPSQHCANLTPFDFGLGKAFFWFYFLTVLLSVGFFNLLAKRADCNLDLSGQNYGPTWSFSVRMVQVSFQSLFILILVSGYAYDTIIETCLNETIITLVLHTHQALGY
jgi:hypothetical protein